MTTITTQDQAKQYATDWQNSFADNNYTYSELAEFAREFAELAEKFNLVEEFTENGII